MFGQRHFSVFAAFAVFVIFFIFVISHNLTFRLFLILQSGKIYFGIYCLQEILLNESSLDSSASLCFNKGESFSPLSWGFSSFGFPSSCNVCLKSSVTPSRALRNSL